MEMPVWLVEEYFLPQTNTLEVVRCYIGQQDLVLKFRGTFDSPSDFNYRRKYLQLHSGDIIDLIELR